MGAPPAKKSRKWLLIGAPVVAVVLIAAGLTAFFVFHKSDKELITNATYSFADAINRDDMSAAAALMCADRAHSLQDTDDADSHSAPDEQPQERGFTVTDVTVNGDSAAATLTFDKTGTTRQLDFQKEGGAWKVCGE